jgi:cytoskeleton protein RodZ
MVEAGKDYLFIDGDSDIGADRIVPGPHTDIGAELRAAREARELDISTAAQDLRIREDYLRSLESGAYDGLPGIPYAVGFVRSYAKYLRLDAADMVRRFKAEAEADAAPERGHLAFPQPVRYGRFPGIALVALSLIGGGVLYGGWYLYGTDRNDALTAKARATGDEVAKTAVARAGATAADAAGKKAADAAVGSKAVARQAGTGADPKAGPDASPKGAAAERKDPADADAAPKDPAVGQSVTTSGAPKSAQPGAGAEKSPGQSAALPATPPADDTILLRATANVWLQVKDRDNRVVFVKVLRAGDSYTVPKTDGLIMNVGNAGGLRIVVGGTAIKPLGPTNMPVFNVSLDRRALLEHSR